MDAAVPVVMRGAARDLKLQRVLWSEQNVRRRFGNVNVSLSDIPYKDQFDSSYRPKVTTKQRLDEFIDTFSATGTE